MTFSFSYFPVHPRRSLMMSIPHFAGRVRTGAAVLLVSAVMPAVAKAQACLGLHASRHVPVASLVSNFHRDGVTGPSSLGVSVTAGDVFVAVQTCADLSEGRWAVAANGIGGTVGLGLQRGLVDACTGVSMSSGESLGASNSSSKGAFGAASVKLPDVYGVPFSAFGVASYESRESEPRGLRSSSESGMAFRVGLASYPKPWVGIRLFEDRFRDGHRLGFSIAFSAPLKREDADRDGVKDAADQCADTPVGTTVDAVGCPVR